MFAEVCNFCVLREQILQLGKIDFSCWELIFVISVSLRPVIVDIFLWRKFQTMLKFVYPTPYVTDDFSLSFDYSNIWDDWLFWGSIGRI